MAKSVSQSMEELRRELFEMRKRAERLRADGDLKELDFLERWIVDAEKVLTRWDPPIEGEP